MGGGTRRPDLRVLVLAGALLSGCVVDGGLYDPIGRGGPWPAPPYEDDRYDGERESYEDGYRRGWRDRERGDSPDHSRYEERYDRSSERSFRSGYADGYQRRPNRYGDDGGSIQATVPRALIGEFRGYDERGERDAALVVRRSGEVTLALGGRAQNGRYRDGWLELRKGSWRIQAVRGGVVISPEWDRDAPIRLQRR